MQKIIKCSSSCFKKGALCVGISKENAVLVYFISCQCCRDDVCITDISTKTTED